ncbi:uncharacterized protein LOC114751995 isoform X2 [Neltuma alba]|uniref:uncharacterized protein LOC114751995 isoform X2 n=1 Tax=Neltuma alba TaxID=207710 RepID=UPI0010A48EE1|nr:uncharacterized protein LOC114751995 isoform X2 [Prosopis alba]
MEDSEAQGRLEERIRSLSKGAAGHEAEAEAARGLSLVKLHRGFLLCNFKVHRGVSDESGKWHEGAMTTLMDIIGSWTAFSFTSQNQETVEVEGKAMGKTGKITSVKVEVRKKEDGQTVALGIMWMAPSHPNPTKPLPSKL